MQFYFEIFEENQMIEQLKERIKEKMKEFFKQYSVVLLILIIIPIIGVSRSIVSQQRIKSESKQVQVFADVTDKYSRSVMAGKTPVKQYFVKVRLKEDKTEYQIQLSSNEYSSIEIGNEVYCTLYYTKDEIVSVELASSTETKE